MNSGLAVAALCASLAILLPAAKPDPYTLWEQPGRMVRLHGGNRLSLYCTGNGQPTVVLEAGFGGGAYATWHELQPRVAAFTRVCSYDRAGYGFSELGTDLPRDIQHDVTDLHELLRASGEPGPYVLAGHSDGGHIIGAFSDVYAHETAALIFLDAAVLVDRAQVSGPPEKTSPEQRKYYDAQLAKIRGCLKRAEASNGAMEAAPGDYCLDSQEVSALSPGMARALAQIAARTDNWRAYLSEAEQHYTVDDPSWEISLLPHHWEALPIQVFTASVASLDDQHSAALYGLPAADHAAIAAARAGRARWEGLQARICELSSRCEWHKVLTAQHMVQNAVPDEVAESIRGVVLAVRAHGQ